MDPSLCRTTLSSSCQASHSTTSRTWLDIWTSNLSRTVFPVQIYASSSLIKLAALPQLVVVRNQRLLKVLKLRLTFRSFASARTSPASSSHTKTHQLRSISAITQTSLTISWASATLRNYACSMTLHMTRVNNESLHNKLRFERTHAPT